MSFQAPITVDTVLKRVHQNAYVLPAIQREFVWDTQQICLLFDSLLRGYPIGSFLFWDVAPPTAEKFTFYEFLRHYHEKETPYAPSMAIPSGQGVVAILDGQQRLTALNIGLYGSHAERVPYKWSRNPDAYPKKHLYIDLAGEGLEEDLGMQYGFKFLTEREASDTEASRWYRAGEILKMDAENSGPAIMAELGRRGLEGEKPFQVLWALFKAIRETPTINHYVEESQDPNKVLDIFVRVNSAGTVLSYSDLLLSMATNQWQELDAREEVRSLLTTINGQSPPFAFSKDLVLKAGLMLIDAPDVRFKVANFTQQNMALLEKRWSEVRSALIVSRDLLASFGFSERTLTSDSVLIPLAYYVFFRGLDSSYVESAAAAGDRGVMRGWVTRSLMKRGIWGSGLDTLLSRLRDAIRASGAASFPTEEIETAMAGMGKSLKFDDAEIAELCDLQYGRRRTFPVLATLYPGLDLTKSFHEDHIFPKSRFTRKRLEKVAVSATDMPTFMERFDTLPNLQLLEGLPNVEKQAMTPAQWMESPYFTSEAMREHYLVINDLVGLPLDLVRFLEFYDGRRSRIEQRLRQLLGTPPSGESGDGRDLVVDDDADEELDEDFEDTSDSPAAEVLSEELNGFLARRLPNPDKLARVHALLREVLSWPDTTVRLGTSKRTEDGKSNWAAISRGGWGGRFLVLFPKAMRVRFRLGEDDVSDLPEAEFRKVRPGVPWRVRGNLTASNGVETCITMARRAYDHVGRGKQT